MLVSEFDFSLPPELIAQEPLAERAASRMLRLQRTSGRLEDTAFRNFPSLLRPDDLVVFNNTRVFPARLYGRRSGERAQPVSERNPATKEFLAGRVEVMLTKQAGPMEWEALVRPGRKIGVGEKIFFGEATRPELIAEVISRAEFGERKLRFTGASDEGFFFSALERIGHIPLPPYIDREDTTLDRDRYQTVFARDKGSVAAPTAGLHFTREILGQIHSCGVETAEITLHVGLGTFQPVRHERVEDNHLHSERYVVSTEAAEKINRAKAGGRRVVAVGTTTVRTLEYVASLNDGVMVGGSSEANIFIYPGFKFRIVDALLTNFHLPKSTLLMLVCAFAGKESVLRAYEHAVRERYRFFSYGDCMLVD